MGDSAVIDLRGDNAQLRGTLGESRAMFNDFGSTIKRVAIAAAAAFAAVKIVDFGRDALAAFGESEEAIAKLNAVLKATGNVTGLTSKQMQGLASELQRTTKFTDEAVIGAETIIATFKNIRGDNFAEATRLAADMATVLGSDLQSAAMQVAKALNDPIQGVSALRRAGVQLSEQQEEQIKTMVELGDVMGAQRVILNELAGEFGGAAEAAGATFLGSWERTKNRFGDLMEAVGEAIVPAMETASEWLGTLATVAENVLIPGLAALSQAMRELWLSITEFMEPVLTGLVDGFVAAFTAIEVAIENFSTVARLGVYAFALAWVAQFETIRHWLTVVIPDLLMWFGRNWVQVFTDVATGTAAIFENMWKNIDMFFTNVWKWLSGQKTEWVWTGLLEGFESTLTELPSIAERHKGEIETALENIVGDLSDELGRSFDERFAQNREAVRGFAEFAVAPNERTKPDLRPGAFERPTVGSPKVEIKEAKAEKATVQKVEKLDINGSAFQSTIVGLEELNRRITVSAASGGPLEQGLDKVEAVIVQGANDTVKELARQTQFAQDLLTKEDRREKQIAELIAETKKLAGIGGLQ